MRLPLLATVTSCLLATIVCAQQKSNVKFGNVKAEDFNQTVYSIDSNAAAVILAEIGSTEIVGNNKGTFSLMFKKFQRAHILNKNGYDIGNVEIPLYTNGQDEEELEHLKAVSYNLENGKIIETKLDVKSAVFKDKINKHYVVKKFTFPNLKAGTIIEFEYRIKSDFIFNLQPWEFQGIYPRLWSEYNVAMPSFYNYVTLTQGYHPYFIKDSRSSRSIFNMAETGGAGQTQRAQFEANVTDLRWVMKDVPALKEESYTSTPNNHIAKIEFQLASIGEPFVYKQVMSTWDMVAKELMESEDFGAVLKKENGWLNDAMEAASAKGTSLQSAWNIFNWIRNNFTCTGKGKYLEEPLKNILKTRSGNVAAINLLLTAMLRKAGFNSHPVLLSTRSHGYANAIYPLLDRFNYVISAVEIEGKTFFLDASEPGLGFGKLGAQCYNGHARIIANNAIPVELDPSTVKEVKNTIVFAINDEEGKYIGSVKQTPGYFESLRLRNTIREKGKGQLEAQISKSLGENIKSSNLVLDSLNRFDDPLGINYEIKFDKHEEPLIYFNPLMGESFGENPFKSATRYYPVEMPYTMENTFSLQMEIPNGYAIDELPKPMVIKFNEEEDAIYEYRISTSGNSISFRSRLLINKAFFQPEEYEVLREFFSLIVKKQNEQIVFKKKSNP